MADPKPLTDDQGEVRELRGEDFAHAIPFSALPVELQQLLSSPQRKIVPDAESKEPKQPAA